MDTQTRLVVLAHLKNGKTPSEVSEITEVSYAQALKLRKELHAAEENNTLMELFSMSEAALDILLDSVKSDLAPIAMAFDSGEILEGELTDLKDALQGGGALNEQTQKTATILMQKIGDVAVVCSNAETILSLARAVSEMQVAFFGAGVHGNNGMGDVLQDSSFKRHLKN